MERKGFTMKMALDTTAVPSGGLRAKTGLRHKLHSFFVYVKHHPMLYLMLIPGLFFLFIYKLAPLYGILIAFKDYNIFLGSNPIDAIGLSDWVGLEHFRRLFASSQFTKVLANTLIINGLKILWLFPIPIICAILLNEIRRATYRKFAQTAIYMPYFFSWVVIFGIFYSLFGSYGIINTAITAMGGTRIGFFTDNSVYYMTEHENFGKMIEFLSKCQQEGLLDPDWAVNTSSTVQEKLAGGKAIIAQINRNGLGETTPTMLETLGLTYDDLGYIGALKGSDGTCKYMRTEAINFVTVILRGSENAADAVNWINLKQQNQLYINIGVEGTHFNYDEDGGIAPINPIFAEERGNSYWYIDSTNEEEFATEWPSRVRKSDAQWAGFEAVTLYANENTPEIFVNNDFAFKPATENYAKYNTALFSSMNDYILQILAGTKTLDDLPTFQADWKNAGGDAVQAELQAWYDSFYG